MVDRIPEERRSRNMSRIRGKDTKPELILRSALHKRGFRFRLHVSTLPGRPDIVLPKYNSVIFVNGCFWHRHPGCRQTTFPSSNKEFWMKKFAANVKRDAKNCDVLKISGWKVHTVWECELESDLMGVVERLSNAMKGA